MESKTIELRPKWWVQAAGYAAAFWIIYMFGNQVIEFAQPVLAKGWWSGYLSMMFMIAGILLGIFTILVIFRTRQFADEESVLHKGLSGTKRIPYSRIESIEVDSTGVKLQGDETSISMDIFHSNFYDAIRRIKERVESREDIEFKGKAKDIEKHFGDERAVE